MVINEKMFGAYCSNCNTEITDIKYEELKEKCQEGETLIPVKWSYENKKTKIWEMTCPVCGEPISVRPQGTNKEI